MAPTYERAERPATDLEVERLVGERSDLLASFGVILFFASIWASLGVALGVAVDSRLVQALGFSMPAMAGLYSAIDLYRSTRPMRKLELEDAQEATVEVLKFANLRCWCFRDQHSSVDPGFAFELPGSRTLMLMGPWLAEPETYGGGADDIPEDDEAIERFANGLAPPLAFPASHFALHRFPRSGYVVGIEILGDYVVPETGPPEIELAMANGPRSRLLDCDLAGLAPVIAGFKRR